MNQIVKNSFSIQNLLSLLIIGLAVLCIIPMDNIMIKNFSNFSVQIMFLFLLMGLLFLMLRQKNLMMVSFLSCAALCLVLRDSFDERTTSAFYPKLNDNRTVEIAHFNVSAFNEEYSELLKVINESDADIISIQEVTPDWNYFLKNGLAKTYPHSHTVVRIDFHGLAVYSKHPFTRIDTFHYQEIPNLVGSFQIDSTHGEIFFICSHTEPPVNRSAYEKIDEHLDKIAAVAGGLNGPVLTIGDYNVVPWSPELQAFRLKANLSNSRRSFTASNSNSSMPFLSVPIDHIFYSSDFQCVSFDIVTNEQANVGIKGTYQFKYKYVQRTIQ